MRVVSDLTPAATVEQLRRIRGKPGVADKLRALILRIATILFSDRNWWSGYRVTVEKLRDGNVGVAMSVLYRPFEEIEVGKPYASPPESGYFAKLIEDLEAVEAEVASQDPATIRIVHNRAELEKALRDGATALVHCVEGGFHLGDGTDEIEANVAELARRGVAYVTLAHLLFRQVATNAPALPFLADAAYRRLFPQPPNEGLTERGIAAVRAMVRNRVLIDVAHMRRDALTETFALLDDELDPDREMPVAATHAGYRFGDREYLLDDSTVLEIKRRDGVIGLLMSQHQLNSGVRLTRTKTFAESFEVICRHIDKIAAITGSHRHVALGTDFDGFIKPTMGGLEHSGDLAQLESALRGRYGDDAELICSENALRVLRQLWPKPVPRTRRRRAGAGTKN
jgi:microsomal dipeptidase-like Zn-dependent dipeptidase